MMIQGASEHYQISMHVLREYESWGLCGAVKKVMGNWQYDDSDLERLSTIMTLHDIGFTSSEVKSICGCCWMESPPAPSVSACWWKSAAPLWM